MKNDKYLQFDSLIDTLDEDSLEAEDIRELSPEERQMFLVAKNLKGIASYDPVQAEAFKKRLSEKLRALPIASEASIPVVSENSISSFFGKIRGFFTVQKRTFALSFAVLLLVFVAVVTNISQRPAPDTETSRLIADLSSGVNASLQNERDLHAAFSPVEMDDLELLELSSSLDDFDPNAELNESDVDRDLSDFNSFSNI